jgi:uncharacterized protein (DUF924 family)
MSESWVEDVLRFWFQECTPAQWFRKDEEFDRRLRERFAALNDKISKMPTEACLGDARTALAAVIVCDQFPRNMHRGSARAFACDAHALAIAEGAVARGYDAGLSKDERSFLYLPFEHAEDAAAQARAVALMATLDDPDLLKWAQAHKVIIDRFGRFPHRNATLGRTSTPEEVQFLSEPGSSF